MRGLSSTEFAPDLARACKAAMHGLSSTKVPKAYLQRRLAANITTMEVNMDNNNQGANNADCRQKNDRESNDSLEGRTLKEWAHEISHTLRWINDRAWPLAGVVLFIAAIYLNSFIIAENVPLSLTSSAVITALPVIGVFLALLIGSLVAFFLSPTVILFTRFGKKSTDTLLKLSLEKKNGDTRKWNNRLRIIMLMWFLKVLFIATVLVVPMFIASRWIEDSPDFSATVLILLVLALTPLFIYFAIKHLVRDLKIFDIVPDFWITTIIAILPQTLILAQLLTISAHHAEGSNVKVALFMLAGALALTVLQIGGAWLLALLNHPGQSLKRIGCFVLVPIFLFGIYPASGAWLAGAVMQLTASGARACAVLTWAEPDSVVSAQVRDKRHPGSSVRLRILTEADGQYLVRPEGETSKVVYFVPRTSVASINACPRNTGDQTPELPEPPAKGTS
jgi:hypothetical protein